MKETSNFFNTNLFRGSRLLTRMVYIELADDDDFVLQFAMNMEFANNDNIS